MFNIEQELEKFGLTGEKYEALLKECSDKVAKITDKDWSEITSEYGIDLAPDTCRKASQTILGGSFVRQYYEEKKSTKTDSSDDEEYLNKLRIEKQEIQKEKRKLYDERLELSRARSQEARREETWEILKKAVQDIGNKRYLSGNIITNKTDSDMVICLSDLHIGSEFYSFDGNYNSSIAIKYMNEYLSRAVEIGKKHNVENVIVCGLGDYISGSIHKKISISNRENVIEQVKMACLMICDFIDELSKNFTSVKFYSVSGNHSRLDTKDDAPTDERLDSLVPWFVKNMLCNKKENVEVFFEDNSIDYTVNEFFVRGNLYLIVHGDYDGMNETSIARLCLWVKSSPYCVIMGHKHFPAFADVSGIKVIQCGSLCGSGDEYTREKRLTGKPSQTILICNDNGIEACYPVTFGDYL